MAGYGVARLGQVWWGLVRLGMDIDDIVSICCFLMALFVAILLAADII